MIPQSNRVLKYNILNSFAPSLHLPQATKYFCIIMNISGNFRLLQMHFTNRYKGKSNAIPATGRGGPWGCETSMLSQFL
jgi:hypothetical protein